MQSLKLPFINEYLYIINSRCKGKHFILIMQIFALF